MECKGRLNENSHLVFHPCISFLVNLPECRRQELAPVSVSLFVFPERFPVNVFSPNFPFMHLQRIVSAPRHYVAALETGCEESPGCLKTSVSKLFIGEIV